MGITVGEIDFAGNPNVTITDAGTNVLTLDNAAVPAILNSTGHTGVFQVGNVHLASNATVNLTGTNLLSINAVTLNGSNTLTLQRQRRHDHHRQHRHTPRAPTP